MSDKKQIKVGDILEMLNSGKTRKDIAAHYEIPMTQLKRIFEHDKLKGRKARPSVDWVLIDDTVGETATDVEQSSNAVPLEEQQEVLQEQSSY